MRSTQAAPPRYWMPPASTTPRVEAMSAISDERALADTSVISAGSSRGVTALRVTPYAFCRISTPNAAGKSVSGSCSAADIPQHSRPRASSVPDMMKRRPCWTRSSIGPMNGASTTNGAMVTSR